MDDSKKKTILSIIHFLEEEISGDILDDEQKESLEVAIQCLQSTYEIRNSERVSQVAINLHAAFKAFLDKNNNEKQAENLKEEGNKLMRNADYAKAIECYTYAIKLNPNNARYFCNRAAAYDRIKKYEEAISDCKEATKLNPLYSKAYARLGNTYMNLQKYEEPKEAYMNAVEIDGNNEDYKANLSLCEHNIKQNDNMMTNISSLLNNPSVINLTTQLLSDPSSLRNLVGSIVTSNEECESDANIENLAQILTDGMQLNNSRTVEELLASLANKPGGTLNNPNPNKG